MPSYLDLDEETLSRLRDLLEWLEENGGGGGDRIRIQIYSKYTDEVTAEQEGWHANELEWGIRSILEGATRYQALVDTVKHILEDEK